MQASAKNDKKIVKRYELHETFTLNHVCIDGCTRFRDLKVSFPVLCANCSNLITKDNKER